MDVLQQGQVLLLVGGEELLGGLLHVQRGGDAARGLQHGQAAGGVQLGQLDHHGLQLAGEQVHGLATKVVVAARGEAELAGVGVLAALDPVPLALAGFALPVGEDEQVFGVAVGHMPPHGHAQVFVGPAAVHHHLDGDHAAEFGHGAVGVGGLARLRGLPLPAGGRLVPAQHVEEQALEVEGREVFLEGREVKPGHQRPFRHEWRFAS